MRAEIRATNEATACEHCGAGELIYSRGQPVTADLTRVLEREVLRREITVLKMLRDHLDHAERDKIAASTRHRAELFDLKQQHREQVDAVKDRLAEAKIDVPKWRAVRARRERLFAERIDGVLAELQDATRHANI